MKIYLFIAALFMFSASFAQDYIITMRSDTLTGQVRILSYDILDRVQLFQGKKKTIFTALQVRRISIKNEQYAPVKYDNSIRMMKVIRSGFLSLYGYRAQSQTSFDTQVLQKLGGSTVDVPNIGFKRIVGDVVSDCVELMDQVKNGDLDRDQIVEIVDRYNKCVTGMKDNRISAATNTPTTDLIEKLRTKVNASDLANKGDVDELLTSISNRVKKKEPVPSYMKDALKEYTASNEELKADTEQLLKSLE
jgi:hypothetical protein